MTTSTTPGGKATEFAQALVRFLEERRESLSPLLILTHDYPDPDALAAAFGLQHMVQAVFRIESRIAYGGVVGRTENKAMVRLLRIPIHKIRPAWFKKFAALALVDTQPAFENNAFPANRRATLVIDQHPSVVAPNAELALVDPECGATCVIVAQALLQLGLPIPPRVATALAYGILTDTLDLYRAQRPDVVQTYLQVLHHCDMRLLASIQNPPRPRRFFATLGKGIREATRHQRLLVTHLGPVESPDLVSQVAEFLLVYKSISWCLVTGRYKGRLNASLRTTRPDAQAGEVLRDAFENRKQAGGHGAMAGGSCRVDADASEEAWQAKEQDLQARVLKRLRIPARTEPRKPFQR
jgi:nanoRNase/pAp phosphatase (c-di-AMP/oligoRNAs hydrolase)